MSPDGIVVLPSIGNTGGIFCILEHTRMSDVTDQYLLRARKDRGPVCIPSKHGSKFRNLVKGLTSRNRH